MGSWREKMLWEEARTRRRVEATWTTTKEGVYEEAEEDAEEDAEKETEEDAEEKTEENEAC